MSLKATRLNPELITIEALDEEIATLASRMTAQEYELLVLIRTFDERGGWLKWGSASCADWLHWRCDLSLSAAREKVRVARALKDLPVTSEAFAAGKLSYSKVRALTRVADATSETDLLDFALNVSAALVEQRCQQLRNVRTDSASAAARVYERRALSAFRSQQGGAMTLTVELPREDGELVLNALDKVLAGSFTAADASTSYRARQADALVELCKMALAADPEFAGATRSLRGGISVDPCTSEASSSVKRPVSTADQYQVVVHVDQSAISDDPAPGARSDLSVETVRRLTCDGTVVALSSDKKTGVPSHIGRKRRAVPTALRRALRERDRHCRFPGCSHTRFVDAHHVQHWAQGGETSLDNLMLLCSHHHRLVHEGGFQVFVDYRGQQSFRRPDGRTIPACGYRSEDQLDQLNGEGENDPSAEGCDQIGVVPAPA